MPEDDTPLAALVPVVRALMQSHRIPSEAVRGEGRVVLTLDQRWRVHLVPTAHARVALQSELLALPEQPGRTTDDALLYLAKVAAGLLRRHASSLAIDARRRALVLQQLVPATASLAELEDALADFTNALDIWSRASHGRSGAPTGTAP